ncbi:MULTISPECIES: hypothetical protein [Paenibacillus]|uniref:Uncharacterized protein n=1 Tax=Paenibacillus barengoltzii J12 TaxID=935846 RepID=A0ABY1LTI5_9BACL|nr:MULTISPECIES: hypothetical protein [Paenibacillus]MDU0329071.1 hypothetical protein [Paenibacillus sp. 3LSP]SMF00383.1 hypothetical protein SAMN02744124_00767 [Paenibacillus barengoltzii J12]
MKKLAAIMLSFALLSAVGITTHASVSANNSIVPVDAELDNEKIKVENSADIRPASAAAAARAVAQAATKGWVYVKEAVKHYADDIDRVVRDASMYVGGADLASENPEAVEAIFDLK